MEHAFGLPRIDPASTVAGMFGPYHFEGETRFWRYSPDVDAWSVLTAGEPPRPVVYALWPSDEETMHEAFDYARMCPPSGVPSDPNARAVGDWFALSGWRFRWVYYPDLERWELAPGGRA